MASQSLTCALCPRRCRISGPTGSADAQRAGWRWSMSATMAWCPDHSAEALSGKSTESGTQARF